MIKYLLKTLLIMQKQNMTKLHRYLWVFCLLLFIPVPLAGEQFYIEEATRHREIKVTPGKDFKITLCGVGWYLNRYDRGSLSFKLRVIEPDSTSFIIRPHKKGISYLLFSHLKNDVYILVKIGFAPEEKANAETAEEGELKPDVERVNKRQITSDIETAKIETATTEKAEAKLVEGEKEQVQEEIQIPFTKRIPEESKETARETQDKIVQREFLDKKEIYYFNKENKVVVLPVKNENDPYNKGVQFMSEGKDSKAVELFLEYIADCNLCRYRIDARMRLAELSMRQNKDKEALYYLDEVIKENENASLKQELKQKSKEAYSKKAEIYLKSGKMLDSATAYRNAYEQGDKDIEILEKAGNIYYKIQNYEDALRTYEECIIHGLRNDEIVFRIASLYDTQGSLRNIEKAYYYYKIIIEKYILSKNYTYARERVHFFEKYFFNYR